MAALNKVLLIGNLGADPEIRTLPSGDKVANLSLATTESYKNKNGERVEETEWHRVEFWGGLAGVIEQYVKKGDSLYVEGRIRTEKYTDSNNIERYSTKIRATNMQMLTRRSNNENSESNFRPVAQAPVPNMPVSLPDDDDLPF